jgi:tRNA 2-selenouridine synthase
MAPTNPYQAHVSELANFDCIIDVRSPDEYAHDHIPGAINLPVLDNAQRAEVGTMYKQVSAFAARKLGAAYIAANIAQHLTLPMFNQEKPWKPVVYCWRGGMRSGSMVHVLRQIGWPAMQIQGGYREFRRHVIQQLDELCKVFDYRVISGPTGSGKSVLLQALQQSGAQVLDLEQLAAHRGSVLGAEPDKQQPSQKMFETDICHQLKLFNASKPVYVEAESRKIGSVSLPAPLATAIAKQSRIIDIDASLSARNEYLFEHYAHFYQRPDLLKTQLNRLAAYCSKEKVQSWHALIDAQQWRSLIHELLEFHYDPLYSKARKQRLEHSSTLAQFEITRIDSESLKQTAKKIMAL